MIAYLDTSALVKRYFAEPGSQDTLELIARADTVATSLLTRAEVAAALAKGVRSGLFGLQLAYEARRAFASHWNDIAKVPVSEEVVSRAEQIVWDYALRGYDAIQLASALLWQESAETPIVFATFDRQLSLAASRAGLRTWPDAIPS